MLFKNSGKPIEIDESEEFAIEDLDLDETGRPDEGGKQWFASFEDLEPKEEDWPQEPEDADEPEAEEPEESKSEEPEEEIEEPEDAEEPESEEEIEESEESEELKEIEEPEDEVVEKPEEAEEPVETAADKLSEGVAKVSQWLESLGSSVKTGTGWVVSKAKDKSPAKKDNNLSERDMWSEEEEGELDLDPGFWYFSNNPDKPKYDPTEKIREKEEKRQVRAPEKNERDEDDDHLIETTIRKSENTENTSAEEKEEEVEDKKGDAPERDKKPVNKTKVAIASVVILVLLAGGGILGSRIHSQKQQEAEYQATLKKAEQFVGEKKYEDAENLYRELIEEHSDRAELYEELTKAYIAEEKFDSAKNTLNEGIAKTGKSEAYTALSEEIKALTSTEWREPYRRVLASNEWAVRRYDDVNGTSVALCDITGDRMPELFFFVQDYTGYGKLHIYTYQNEKAIEVSYDCKNRSTQYQDAFYDVERDDSSYVIYKSKTDGKFGIYESFLHGGLDAWQTTNRFTLTGTVCKRDSSIEACITTDYRVSEEDDDDDNTEYYKNEKKVKYDTYIKEFQSVLNDIDQVLITSEESSGDKEIWSRIMDIEEVSMDYDGAMKILDEDAI